MNALDELDAADLSLLLERAKAKPEVASRLILGFKDQYGFSVPDLRVAIAATDAEEASHIARCMTKVATMLGATRLAEASSQVETLLSGKDKTGLDKAVARLERAMQPILDAASKLEQSRQEEPSPASPKRGPSARARVLIIDDEPSMRELLADILADDYETLVAAAAGVGLRLAEQELPDLILLDVDLPDANGYAVLTELKKRPATRTIPVMFVTGSSDIASETLGLSLGAVDYVTKPINPAILSARIKSQIEIKRAETEARHRIEREHYTELVAEFERSALIEETRQLQLKVKDDFLSHVSHELRAPAMSIYSFVSLVMDGLAGEVTERQLEYLGIAVRNVEHLQAMIEDLLEATRMGSGKMNIDQSETSIAESVDYALNTVTPAAKRKSIRLSSDCAADLPLCYADPTRLRQTLTILLDNAVKFTPASGSVSVRVRSADQDNSALLVQVKDTGCGISHDKLTSVFDRLYQCSGPEKGRGLGLGLHIAQELVQRQGGRIWVESVVGAGSTFCFTVPVSANKSPEEKQGEHLAAVHAPVADVR